MSTPTPAAMRAARALYPNWYPKTSHEVAANLIDRETGLPELIEALSLWKEGADFVLSHPGEWTDEEDARMESLRERAIALTAAALAKASE